MAIEFTIALNVPALPDNDIWFLNSAAWSNYWQNIDVEATLTPITNDPYVPVAYDTGLQYTVLNVDGVDYLLPTLAMFTSLLNAFNALDLSYKTLRDELKTAGLLTESQ